MEMSEKEINLLVHTKVFGRSTTHREFMYEEENTEDGDGWAGFYCPVCGSGNENSECVPDYCNSWKYLPSLIKKIVGEDGEENDLFMEFWRDSEWFVSIRPLGYSYRKPQAWCDGRKTGKPNLLLAVCRLALILEEAK